MVDEVEFMIMDADDRVESDTCDDCTYYMSEERQGLSPNESFEESLRKKVATYERALKEISSLPSIRQDECCCIALGALDMYS